MRFFPSAALTSCLTWVLVRSACPGRKHRPLRHDPAPAAPLSLPKWTRGPKQHLEPSGMFGKCSCQHS